ncbi:MAG: helix-hairpin-helix domain-containing protein [Planctomycetota bacterium]
MASTAGMARRQAVAALEAASVALEILDDPGFRKSVWRNAARALADFPGDFDDLLARRRLTDIPGIGKSLAALIEAIAANGSHPELDEVLAKLPPGLLELLKIDGIGPKKLQQLWMLHGIASWADLKTAIDTGRLGSFKGFGAKTAEKIHISMLFLDEQRGKRLITDARGLAASLTEALAAVDATLEVQAAGQLARACEVVDALELRVIGEEVEGLAEEVLGAIDPKGEVQFEDTQLRFQIDHTPVRIDLIERSRLSQSAGAGSIVHRVLQDSAPEHRAELRRRATAQGLALAADALQDTAGRALALHDAAEFYSRLGLPFIPPALREGRHEFALADGPGIPPAFAFTDVVGCVHNHTTESDGRHSLEQMVAAARALGLRYFGVADHSQSARYANGLLPNRLLEQTENIDGLNRRLAGEGADFRVLKGVESDILEDGALDYEDWVFERLDYVVASVHSRFNLDAAAQTKRIVRAIEHPATRILGHMTGRLLLTRPGYPLDRRAIFAAAAEHGVAIEFNCHPQRLDVDWRYMQEIKASGAKVIISADAHSTQDLEYLKLGAELINKGGLEKGDILNTRSAEELLAGWGRTA